MMEDYLIQLERERGLLVKEESRLQFEIIRLESELGELRVRLNNAGMRLFKNQLTVLDVRWKIWVKESAEEADPIS